MKSVTNCTRAKYVCGNDRLKLIGSIDGLFPDFGHHLEQEMGGLWLYPVKILDGFWLRFTDKSSGKVDTVIAADSFENYPHKNEFYYGNSLGHTPIVVKRSQFIPDDVDGLIIEYYFTFPKTSENAEKRELSIEFIARSNLRPDWLAEEIGINDGEKDEAYWDNTNRAFVIKDCNHDWFAAVGSDTQMSTDTDRHIYPASVPFKAGTDISFKRDISLSPGETVCIKFFAAASYKSKENCLSNYRKLLENRDYEAEKKDRLEKLLEKTKIITGDKRFDEITDWLKVQVDWLTLETEGVGRGVTAGIPEYLWWFGCDSFYALQGIMLLGDFELCRDTVKIILDYSKKLNGNGRIVHEVLPNGVSPNYGNCQETAQFICFLKEYYIWTGDKSLLREAFDYITLGVNWLMEQDEDGDLFPTGYGIIEIAGLNMEMIDSAVYMAEGLAAYCFIARVLGEKIDFDRWESSAKEAARAVNEKLWLEAEGLYADCFASADTIEGKLGMIASQMEEAGDEAALKSFKRLLSERGVERNKDFAWLLNKNWIIATPMETGLADRDKALRALDRMFGEEFLGDYGAYLEGLRKKHTMTISTGVYAVAQARYGYTDRALELIERMYSSFSKGTPGTIYEMSPDYGCFAQAWTNYGAFTPVIRYMFGINPEPETGIIRIRPNFPKKWKNPELRNLRVLDGEISIFMDETGIRVENTTSCRIVLEEVEKR